MNFLTEDKLMRITPSIFSTESAKNTSEKYAHISTIASVRGLNELGFLPVEAKESRCRNEENLPYVKHLIRFRKKNAVAFDGLYPEIVLVNSHNGTTSYQLRAGIYRLACSNGLIIGNEMFCQ